jgi:hypothetical protein
MEKSMSRLEPGVVLAALLLAAVGGAMLAIPWFGYGPLAALRLALVLGAAAMQQLAESLR